MQCIYSGVKFYSVPGFDTNYHCTAILYLNQKEIGVYRIPLLQIPFKTVTLNICKKNVVIVPSISIAIKHLLTYLVDRVHKHCPCTHSLTSDTKGNNYYKHSNVACFYHFSKNKILTGYKILNTSIALLSIVIQTH